MLHYSSTWTLYNPEKKVKYYDQKSGSFPGVDFLATLSRLPSTIILNLTDRPGARKSQKIFQKIGN